MTTPRLAFSTLGCPDWTLEQVATNARAYGYDGVELRLIDGEIVTPEILRRNRGRIGRLFDDSLPVVALGSSARFSMSDPAERAMNEQLATGILEAAGDVGVPIVRVFGGIRPAGVDVEAGIANVAAGLNSIAPIAEQLGVKVVLETHDDFSSSRVVADVLARVPSAAVGALWDSHHPYRMGEQPDEVWQRLGDRLLHVHVKDARRRGDEWDLVPLGEGEVPVRPIVAELKRRGYAGAIAVEWEKKWHPELADPEIAFPQHITLLREYLA